MILHMQNISIHTHTHTHTHIREWFSSLTERSNLTINTCLYVIFYLHLLSTFRIHIRSLITIEALCFIKSQLRNKMFKMCHLNQRKCGHIRSWTVAPFQRSRGGCAWFDRHHKCAGKMSLYFQLQLVRGGEGKHPQRQKCERFKVR